MVKSPGFRPCGLGSTLPPGREGGAQGLGCPCQGHSASSCAASLCFPLAGSLAGVADLHVGATPGPLLHGQAGMAPPGILGLGPMTSHRASVSAAAWAGERGGILQAWGPFSHSDPLSLPLPAPADDPVPCGGAGPLQPAGPTADVLSGFPATVPAPPRHSAGTRGSEGPWIRRQTPLTSTGQGTL